nr:MAG TPA: hypothetical protein [Caudoviricetes sp.]
MENECAKTVYNGILCNIRVLSTVITPPNGAAYFRVSAKGSGANLIITLNEEIN